MFEILDVKSQQRSHRAGSFIPRILGFCTSIFLNSAVSTSNPHLFVTGNVSAGVQLCETLLDPPEKSVQ